MISGFRYAPLMHPLSDRFSFDAAKTALFRLEAILKQHNIALTKDSLLEAAGYATLRIVERETDPSTDVRLQALRLVGVAELGHQLHRNKSSPHFHKLLPHLSLLSEKTAAAIQVGESSPIDQETNKIFELLVACWLLPLATDIDLDDPEKSAGGTNPDIIATIAGVRWGIACKVLHSRNPKQLLSTVEKGVSQVIAADVDRGVVIVNMKNRLDMNDYWPFTKPEEASSPNPEFQCFVDENTPFKMLREQLSGFVRQAKREAGQATFEDILVKPKLAPAIAMWGHTISPVLHDGHPTITSVRYLVVTQVSDQPGKTLLQTDRDFLEALNDSATTNPEP